MSFAVQPFPGREAPERSPRRWRFLPTLWAVLWFGSSITSLDAASWKLERYELMMDAEGSPTVLAGFFLGGAVADLAVVDRGGDSGRRLRLYSFQGSGWVPRQTVDLSPGVLFVDVARCRDHDRLLTYAPGRLNEVDPGAAAERPLLEVSMPFRWDGGEGIPQIDVTRDLNGDGCDDLLLPGVDGFQVATRLADGTFSSLAAVGPPEPFRQAEIGSLDLGPGAGRRAKTYGGVGITAQTAPWYQDRVHRLDHDGDGRPDLVFWHGNRFEVHLQGEGGTFEGNPATFTTEVSFQSDGIYSRLFDFVDRGTGSLIFGWGEKTSRTVLHSFRDLNGDGIDDLVTLTLSGRSLTRQESVYRVHPGTATPQGMIFSPQASMVLRHRGQAGMMTLFGYASHRFEDLDGDGAVDFFSAEARMGLPGMTRALVGNSVPVDLALYRSSAGRFPETPTRRLLLRRFAPFAGLGKVFSPVVRTGDLNGDGVQDLLVGRSPKELQAFLGAEDPALWPEPPRQVAVELPMDEGRLRLVDLNRDGRQDILISLPPARRGEGDLHRVTVLLSR